MIVLVAVGALIGPSVLGIASNPLDEAGAQLIFTLGVSLILFHGGVGISLRVLSQVGVGLGLLALPGVLITTVIVALAVAPIFGVAFSVALMVGAVLASTDPAILIPLFDRLNIRPGRRSPRRSSPSRASTTPPGRCSPSRWSGR